MNDVARHAGVGTMTVSRVLNGSRHVTPLTAERVKVAVAQLGYRPDEMARALRNSKSGTIGVLLPNLHDPFFATCAHALHTVAKEHGFSVLLTLTNDAPEKEFQEAQRMMQRRVEGLVVIPARTEAGRLDSRLDSREFRHIPIVAMDRPLQTEEGRSIDTVLTENEAGMRRATEHLILAHGLKRIFFVGHDAKLYTVARRYAGYKAAMREAKLTTHADFRCGSEEEAIGIVRRAMSSATPPEAIVTANNLTTRSVLSALLALNLAVPEQVALVGFDDFELSDLLHPALTVIRQPTSDIGQRAAQILFARLAGRRSGAENTPVVLPVELVVRHSCGCAYHPGRRMVGLERNGHPLLQ